MNEVDEEHSSSDEDVDRSSSPELAGEEGEVLLRFETRHHSSLTPGVHSWPGLSCFQRSLDKSLPSSCVTGFPNTYLLDSDLSQNDPCLSTMYGRYKFILCYAWYVYILYTVFLFIQEQNKSRYPNKIMIQCNTHSLKKIPLFNHAPYKVMSLICHITKKKNYNVTHLKNQKCISFRHFEI